MGNIFYCYLDFSVISDSRESKKYKKNLDKKNKQVTDNDIDKLFKELNKSDNIQKSKKIESHIPSIKKTEVLLNINDKILKNYDIKFIYHMTHVNNLQNILHHGLLPHGNNSVNNKIDNPEVNSRRNFIEPIYNKNVKKDILY
jgi:Zn-dependent M16 (insulinase) family peptidase